MNQALEVLKRHWGHADFRKDQRTVVELALDGNDVLVILPTGSGKSACFQVPAMVAEGGAIVISPLIALMKDQVDDCHERKIPATYINSHIEDDERAERLADFIAGAYKLLYIAPERLNSQAFLRDIGRAEVSYIVVDEAHCCSEWGHDFRPDYMRINRLVESLTKRGGARPPILAMTATATEIVVRDIVSSLSMSADHARVVGDPIRPNIDYQIENCLNSSYRAFRIAREIIASFDTENGRHVVYANTRSMAEKIAEMARQEFGEESAAVYHAGFKKEEREAVQDAFKSGKVPIVCATTAFGMGVDVPNIRTVLNFGVPASLEAYVQQCGRAGRDGLPSNSILVVDQFSIDFQRTLVNNANPPWPLYGVVWDYLHANVQPGDKLRKTVKEMTSEIAARSQTHSLTETQVSVVLGVLHSRALIDKRPVEAGTPITLDVVKFESALRATDVKPFFKSVWRTLWTRYVQPEIKKPEMQDERVVTVYVAKGALQVESGVGSTHMVQKALEALEGRGLVTLSRTYTGNIISVREWQADLQQKLPVEKLLAKRDSDFARLNAMLRYTQLATPAERAAFVRNYFLKPETTVSGTGSVVS